jgi:2-phospho-L-lactate guanylyltransferase
MLVVPADLPQLSADAVGTVVRLLAAPRAVALAGAARDGGTNILACRPAGAIPPRFGPRSFAAHCRAARAIGIRPGVVTTAALGHDLDRLDDLSIFLRSGTSTRTHAYLTNLGIEERVPCLAS